MSTMPVQKPGKSVQEVATPRGYLDWVETRFEAKLVWDLAANANNSICGKSFFGPGSRHCETGLVPAWNGCGRDLWLNPPYSKIGPWVEKCCSESRSAFRRVFLLVPASVGSAWRRDYVHKQTRVHFGRRIKFVGHETSYPKDLALCVYGLTPGYEYEDWPAC